MNIRCELVALLCPGLETSKSKPGHRQSLARTEPIKLSDLIDGCTQHPYF